MADTDEKWSAADIPDLSGRAGVVTGANSGIGLEAARELAGAGAHVVLACRDPQKGEAAAEEIRTTHPDAALEVSELDLASLASVRDFAKGVAERHPALSLLVNNAGVMAIPRRETADGFEMQLGTNHLGHFALTGLLLGPLFAAPSSRVVTVTSNAHRMGRMRWNDLQGERSYGRWSAYGQSKLANLLFHRELARRLEAQPCETISVACHPGFAATNLQFAGARMEGSTWTEWGMTLVNRLFAQSAAMGALPTLYAAVADDVENGDVIGPDGIGEAWGHPAKVKPGASARDDAAARRLWEVSEALTGVHYLD